MDGVADASDKWKIFTGEGPRSAVLDIVRSAKTCTHLFAMSSRRVLGNLKTVAALIAVFTSMLDISLATPAKDGKLMHIKYRLI